MKNRVYTFAIGVAFVLATCGVSHAMSELVSITMEPEWPATSEPGTVIVYKITTVAREGQGLLEVSLSSEGLPEGATVSFSPSLLRFTGHALTAQTSTMTITFPSVVPTDPYPFTVTGRSLREQITITNQVAPVMLDASVERSVLLMDPLAAGSMRIRGKGASGEAYKIESTTDLSNPEWEAIGSSIADGNGRFTFFTAYTQDSPVRFYRAVYPEAAPTP